jgi:hypothetical protein
VFLRLDFSPSNQITEALLSAGSMFEVSALVREERAAKALGCNLTFSEFM